jgi:hypothetical protein
MSPLITHLRSAAKACASGYEVSLSIKEVREIVGMLERWVAIKSLDDLPKKQTNRYEQYDCLVYHKGEVKHLVWNCEHVCWDERTGDDFYCDPLEPTHYMLFPEHPSPPSEVAEFVGLLENTPKPSGEI